MKRACLTLALFAVSLSAHGQTMDMGGMHMPDMDMSDMKMPGMSAHDMKKPKTPAKASPTRSAKPREVPAASSTPRKPVAVQAASGTALPAGHAPAPPVPLNLYGDRTYDPAAMAAARHAFVGDNGGQHFSMVMINLAEMQVANGRPNYRWDGEGWWGNDINRLVVKSEGRGQTTRARLDDAEIDAFYSRSVTRYFDVQAGLRQDIGAPNRTSFAFGIEGLSPYWFETEATVFIAANGLVRGRLEGWHDTQLTQRLILQPRTELNFASREDRRAGVSSGLSEAELGLRLRYEWRRQVAPYVGVSWTHSPQYPSATQLVLGVRAFF